MHLHASVGSFSVDNNAKRERIPISKPSSFSSFTPTLPRRKPMVKRHHFLMPFSSVLSIYLGMVVEWFMKIQFYGLPCLAGNFEIVERGMCICVL